MKLLTQAILKQLPPLYSQENTQDPLVVVKFFDPSGSGTWYGIEYDGKDIFFGYVTGLGFDELGNFSLAELGSVRGRFGLGIERDLWWKSRKLSEIQELAHQVPYS